MTKPLDPRSFEEQELDAHEKNMRRTREPKPAQARKTPRTDAATTFTDEAYRLTCKKIVPAIRRGKLELELSAAQAALAQAQAELAQEKAAREDGVPSCEHGIRWPHECRDCEHELQQRLHAEYAGLKERAESVQRDLDLIEEITLKRCAKVCSKNASNARRDGDIGASMAHKEDAEIIRALSKPSAREELAKLREGAEKWRAHAVEIARWPIAKEQTG